MEENKNKQEEMENRDAVELTEQEEQSVVGGMTGPGTVVKCRHCGSPVRASSIICRNCGKYPG